MIKPKLLFSFLIGTFSIFCGDIKGEDNCFFSNVSEYGQCLKSANKSLIPKYPFNPQGNMHFYWLDALPLPLGNNYGEIYTVLNLSSTTGNEINVSLGKKKNSIWNSIGGDFISKKDFKINKKDIIGWKYSNFDIPLKENGPVYNLELNYLDSFGVPQKISFKAYFGTGPYDINRVVIYEFLRDLSDLNNGEFNDITEMQKSKLDQYEKNVDIISSLIKTSQEESCFNVDFAKFPDLIQKYQNLFKAINPLRERLNLAPSSDLKPICD